MTSAATAIGVDIGGSKMILGLLHADGTISQQARISTERKQPEWVAESIIDYARKNGPGLPVGVAANGAVDRHGVVRHGTYIPWNGYPLREQLEQKLGAPAFVQNDVTVAAWGEYILDPARRSVVVIAVGTGIGGGAVIEGRLLVGRGAAMEIGHILLKNSSQLCVCGRVGCLEALASGSAVAAQYQLYGKQSRLASREIAMTAEDVVAAAQEGDDIAVGILHSAGEAIGEVAAVITSVLDPDRIVLSGGLVHGAGELILDPARISFDQHLASPNRGSIGILEKSIASVNPIILGAGSLAASMNG